ncbi:hypothetical protein [Haloarcula litorea]|uniref:hypothetical protein n=1 Tax=Haloarcula litorea TaxID=3032579 RepID=UPI0023E8FAD8|nr:hypothetical protein [Halomicroarcula sp. GDY20]
MQRPPAPAASSPPVRPSRRALLGTVAALASAALAGCGGGGKRTELVLRRADEADELVAAPARRLREDQVALVRTAASDDGAATAYGYEPFAGTAFVRVDGTYYRVRTETAGTATVAKPVLSVEPNPDAADAVPLDRYGGHVAELVAPLTERDQTRVLHPTPSGGAALLPEPRYGNVTWENGTYRLRVEQRRVEQRVHRVRATAAGDDREAFLAHLREAVVTDHLSPAAFDPEAREILRTAIDDAYSEERAHDESFSEPFRTVLEAVRDSGVAVGGRSDPATYLVVYDGLLYRAELSASVSEF